MSGSPTLLFSRDHWLQLAVSQGLLAEAEVAAATVKAQADRTEPAAVLLHAGKLSEGQVAALKAEAANVAVVEVAEYQIDSAVLKLVPESVARTHQVLPLYRIGQALTVAMADPWDAVAIDALRACTKLPIINPLVASAKALQKAIERHYGLQVMEHAAAPASQTVPDITEAAAIALAGKPLTEAANEVSVVKLVDALLHEALEMHASDIHLEPETTRSRVRFRIDGVLHEVKLLPIALHEPLCCRLKIMSKLDIAEHRLPQDGHIPLQVEGRAIDLRLSTYPTVSGENVVIRLLDHSAVALTLTDLGLSAHILPSFQELIHRPHGMVLVTGPTGSGKTTTLYTALQQINDMTKNVMTIEDPVEYHLPLVRQTQVNLKAGITFATGLRSILRQDPDVIMVGEIRDREAADIAIQAALTGHLVLSTLHTNDAAGAVSRLLDFGVEPYLMSSTLLGVMAQRLVRRICPACQEGRRPPAELHARYPELTVVYRGRGCRQCRQTGYSGRIGLFELFVVDEVMRTKVVAHRSADVLRTLAVQRGMRLMRDDGLAKVQQGLTTLEELDRVVPPDLSP